MASSSEKVANIAVSGAPEKSDPERTSISSDDPGLTQPLVGNEELWRGTRPHDNYEVDGLHRWDPTATWDQEEEKALVRKIDIRLMVSKARCHFGGPQLNSLFQTWLCLMFFGLQMDRGNIGNALTDNLLADLNLTTNDYNNGTTIQLLAFLVAELPSQYMIKRLGMERWLPGLMVWYVLSVSGFTHEETGNLITAHLQLVHGVLGPGLDQQPHDFLHHPNWPSVYPGSGLVSRLPLPHRGSKLTPICFKLSTLLASPQVCWLLVSCKCVVFGAWLAGAWLMPFAMDVPARRSVHSGRGYNQLVLSSKFPNKNKAWDLGKEGLRPYHPLQRILRNDPAKGLVQIHEPLKWNDFKSKEPWYVIRRRRVTFGLLRKFTRQAGFSTIESNLLGIPAAALQIITVCANFRSSDYFGDRSLHVLFGEIWSLGPLIALAYLPHHASNWSRFAISTLIGGYPYFHPIVTSWVSENSFDVKKRAVAAATYNVIVQIGSVWWLRRLNAAKERAWNKLTQEQQIEYQSDEAARERDGNRRLDFSARVMAIVTLTRVLPTFFLRVVSTTSQRLKLISHLVARTRRKAPALELETLAPCEMNIKHEVDRSNPPGPVISKYFSMKGAERLDQPRLDERDIGVSVLATRSGTRESRVG
ncbi:MFS transporter [Rhizoctonia solani AG-1 IA]|uniref:MFS transporter n=1 Tax=Thanatephorus cucumeris (strain AG1-IA) TaxID=983506 RepID=L8WVJ5_THACA|nr:MFS transporter [Rhizoctonia solani AG-1 IA]